MENAVQITLQEILLRPHYTSLESVIEENKYLYYKAMYRIQTMLKGDASDWEPWLGLSLCCP